MTKRAPVPRRILRPDPDLLRYSIETMRLTVTQVACELGYRDVSNVYYWCRKWDIPTPRDTHPRRTEPFSYVQRQTVVGTLMGDGSLRPGHRSRKGGANACLVVAHGERQRDYLEWIRQRLGRLVIVSGPDVRVQAGFSAGSRLYTYRTIAHPEFTDLYRVFYPQGRKVISEEVLALLNEEALAVWLMDDGSFNRTRGYIYLSTNWNYTVELGIAQAWFRDRWGATPYIHSAGRTDQKHLAFNRVAADRLREIARPHFFEPLLYKLGC